VQRDINVTLLLPLANELRIPANLFIESAMAKLKTPLLLIASLHLPSILAYDGTTCCDLAKSEGAFISPVPAFDNQTCGQTFSTSLNAALPLYVNYTFCSSKCRGMGLSKGKQPSEWAAPLVQFILPSVIFSMTISRRKKIEFDYVFDQRREITKKERWLWVNDFVQLARSMFFFSVILIPVFIDTVVWIAVIVVGAGNMLTGGLYEAHLDYRIVKYIEDMNRSPLTYPDDQDEAKLEMKRELLITIAAGNLKLDEDKGSPHVTIPKSLTIPGASHPSEGSEKGRSRLLNLLGAQSSFGSAVGSPVLFYLGSFVYTILDLRTDPSSQDAAISLGFGIEWMIIVHVAIVSGCLLASNNPSTSSGIVGSDHEALEESRRWHLQRASSSISNLRTEEGSQQHSERWSRKWVSHKILGWSDAYDTKFQPVSLWSRGSNKRLWIEASKAWRNEGNFRKVIKVTKWGWFIKVLIPALLLIVLPPATGGVVAYFTPPRGLGCRSLSFIVYAFCQVVVTIIATIRCAVDNAEKDSDQKSTIRKIFTGWRFQALSAPFWFGSLIAAVGGTTMQITGVFRNCICYSDALSWWNINNINPAVNLASDTQEARNSSIYWVWMGSTATVFMALNCYIGWWYQRLIRHRFTDAVKAMYMLPEFGSLPHGGENPEPDELNEAVSPSVGGRESAGEREALLNQLTQAPDETGEGGTWAEQTTEALTRHLHTNSAVPSGGSRISTESRGDEMELLLRPTSGGDVISI
jgi:hypothetical protein